MMYEGPVKDYLFETSCIRADGDDINAMRDHELCIYIERSELLKVCEDVDHWAYLVGYDDDFKLSDDDHVAYYRSRYQGKPCYFIVHSAIEYIWVKREDVSQPKALADEARERMEVSVPSRITRSVQIARKSAEELQKDIAASGNIESIEEKRPDKLVHMGAGGHTAIWIRQLHEALDNILTEISGLQQTSQGQSEDWEARGMGKVRLLEEWEWLKERLGITLWRQELGDPDIPKPKMDGESPFEPRRPKNPIANWFGRSGHQLSVGELVVREDGIYGVIAHVLTADIRLFGAPSVSGQACKYTVIWFEDAVGTLDQESTALFEPVFKCRTCGKFIPWSEGADTGKDDKDDCDTCRYERDKQEKFLEEHGWVLDPPCEEVTTVMAYPDKEYPIRLLEAALHNNTCSTVTDNLAGKPPENPVCIAINEASAERAEMLKQAIAILRRG